jgi:hypothetical protein
MINKNQVRETLRAGLAWMLDTDQPPDAAAPHLIMRECGNITLKFYPGAKDCRIHVTLPFNGRLYNPDPPGDLMNKITDDVAAITAMIDELGQRSRTPDGMAGSYTHMVPYLIEHAAHPGLLDAMRRLCPTHHQRDCDADEPECPWRSTAISNSIKPAWPALATIDSASLISQRAFSHNAFGPGPRTAGVLAHIRKELAEIEQNPDDLFEWIDVVLLALDGALRAGHDPQSIIDAYHQKRIRNEARIWPDWRQAEPGTAIEHVRDAGGAHA